MPRRDREPKARQKDQVTDNQTLHFSTLGNGLDFLLAGLQVLGGDPSPRQVKYAVLHVAAGTALVHKERLQHEHWSLIFDDIRAATKKRHESGEFRSVDSETCLQRLEGICGIEIDAKGKRSLASLAKRRNRIEHFGISEPLTATKASVSAVLGHVIAFIDEQLGPLAEDDAEVMEQIRALLGAFRKFVDDRWKEIKAQVNKHRKHLAAVECPRCTQEALGLGDGDPKCFFCGYTAGPEEAADEYINRVMGLSEYAVIKDGGDWPRHQCPGCDWETLVDLDASYVCFNCGTTYSAETLDGCSRCGRLYEPGDGENYTCVCPECWADIAARD